MEVGGRGTGSYTMTVSRSKLTDDHADLATGATVVAVGETAAGAIEFGNDADYFAFEAEAGRTYEIQVTLGTLEDSVIGLFDEAGSGLEFNDDDEDSLASRIVWTAPSSATFYLQVRGYGAQGGSYFLLIAVR